MNYLSKVILALMLLSAGSMEAKHKVCYLGVMNGDAVGWAECQRVNGFVSLMLGNLERVTFVDHSALGISKDEKEDFKQALQKNGITYTVALKLDSVVAKERKYTRKNKEGNKEEYVRYEGRTNFDVIFTRVKTGEATTKHAYTMATKDDRDEAMIQAMDGVDGAVKTFMLNFFPITGKVKIIDHEKTALITVGLDDGVVKGDDFGIYDNKGNSLGKLDCKEVLGRHASQGNINRNKNVKAILQAMDNGEELSVKTLRTSEPIFSKSMLNSGSLQKTYDDAKSIVKGIGNLFK